jgi:hypothetical protein
LGKRVRFWFWERSRCWAATLLLREIQTAYNAGEDSRARRMSCTLDHYLLIERNVLEYISIDPCAPIIIHYPSSPDRPRHYQ